MQQPTDLEAQALALLQTFPPPARSSLAIMQEVETILATSSQLQEDMAALKEKSWDVYLAQLDNSSHATTTIYAPTTYIVNSFNRGSYNRDSFNDDHSDRSTTVSELDWGRGLLFALLALAAWVLGSSTGYLDGLSDAHRSHVEVQP